MVRRRRPRARCSVGQRTPGLVVGCPGADSAAARDAQAPRAPQPLAVIPVAPPVYPRLPDHPLTSFRDAADGRRTDGAGGFLMMTSSRLNLHPMRSGDIDAGLSSSMTAGKPGWWISSTSALWRARIESLAIDDGKAHDLEFGGHIAQQEQWHHRNPERQTQLMQEGRRVYAQLDSSGRQAVVRRSQFAL
jgi:hypothetical protein